jgi:hypothetical protein
MLHTAQMAVLVEDFLHSPGIDPQVEAHFRSFLAHQRVRCAQAGVHIRMVTCSCHQRSESPALWRHTLTDVHHVCRSFPKLETTLDWVLQLYWVILPALV